MNSLKTRLLLSSFVVLGVFVALTGVALQQADQRRALSAEEDRLQGLVYALLGAMEVSADGVEVNLAALPEPRLQRPDSGVYAVLLQPPAGERWRSPSYVDRLPPALAADAPPVGEWRFRYTREGVEPLFALGFSVRWLVSGTQAAEYYVLAMREAAGFERRQGRFKRTLWAWLIASAAVLMAVQFAVLRWGLTPLRTVSRQVREIEGGQREALGGDYPLELRGLVDGLNALLRHEQRQRARYRNALDDLAHSLKTPLAALRALQDSGRVDARIEEQLTRMDDIVRYQLSKAATAGARALRTPIAVSPVAEKLIGALRKVYRDKPIAFTLDTGAAQVRADTQDLMEILGNLLDNAAKHCRSEVRLSALAVAGVTELAVEDDGDGFPPDAQRLLERGARADARHPGQGLGLAMVAEIVAAYDGKLALGASAGGGARVTVMLPA